MSSYLEYAIYRRDELQRWPKTAGTGFQAGPIGNRTTAHLNLTTPLQPILKPSIAITRGKKK